MVECVSGQMAAIPLLWLTSARTNTNWPLVVSLIIFGGIGSPIGAALLLNLNPRIVEFVMASILLVVIGLHCGVTTHITMWLSRQSRTRCVVSNTVKATATCDVSADKLPRLFACIEVCMCTSGHMNLHACMMLQCYVPEAEQHRVGDGARGYQAAR